jgi:hypothetical protein
MSIDLADVLEQDTLDKAILATFGQAPARWTPEDVDALGQRLNTEDELWGLDFSAQDYWFALKAELHLLLCSDDPKYSSLKNSIKAHGKRSQTAIISAIAVFVGAHLGVEAGVITPYCALLLQFSVKVGKEAFCRSW